jgi:transcriptional regulator with XRE-family HTH domain
MDPQELRRRRLGLGLSQRQLAARLDVSHETISRWERGALNIAAPGMLHLALAALEQATTPPPLPCLAPRAPLGGRRPAAAGGH